MHWSLGPWLLAIAAFAPTGPLWSDDWPAYRHDAARSSCAQERISLPLACAWVRPSRFPPSPAWAAPANQDYFHKAFGLTRVDEFDLAFHPIIAGGRLFYGSSATDTLDCLDAASGRLLWNFVTEGPIRVVPVYADGRVYCGSDDGWLYCLEAATGRQLWRHRPGLSDRRLPGNSRMISRWPVRSGLVVRGGWVYCAAGVFPSEGVFLCAVDCRDGHEIWKHELQTTLHGPMVAAESRLFAPALRGPVQAFDLTTGQPAGEAGGGGSLAAIVGGRLVTGPTERGAIAGLDPQVLSALGGARSLQLAASGDGRLVLASERTILAFDQQRRAAWKADRKGIHALLLADNRVFAGGDGLLTAYRLSDGREEWSGKISGTVRGLAAAGGSLFAATEDGAIHCFANGPVPVSERAAADGSRVGFSPPSGLGGLKPTLPLHRDQTSQSRPAESIARNLLQTGSFTKGYCLVLGAGDYSLAAALARQSDLQIVAVDDDRAAVKAAREDLARQNLYGPRIAIHVWPDGSDSLQPARLPYPDWVFNLIVIRAKAGPNGMSPVAASEAFRMLRPDGGTLVALADATADRTSFEAWGAALPEWKVELRDGMFVGTARRGRLAGGGEWTHQYANAGNTACSDDTLQAGGGELQWFGPPGPRAMVDRHNRTAAPLFHQGRLFVAGEDSLTGVDAYNGAVLWRKEVPKSMRLAVSMDCGNTVAGSGAVYLAAGKQCLGFDGATGDSRGTFELPPVGDRRARQWAYLGICDGLLIGTATVPRAVWTTLSPDSWSLGYFDQSPVGCSYALFAFDVRRPSVLWTYEPADGLIVNPTVAVDAGQAIFVEGLNAKSRELGDGRYNLRTLVDKGARLVAIDIRTGRLAWSRAIDMSTIQTSPFLAVSADTILLSGAKNVGARLEYELHAFRRVGGEPLWSRSFSTGQNVGGSHGEQNQHPVIVAGRVVFKTFSCSLSTGDPIGHWRLPDGGCGTLSASQRDCFFRSGPAEVDLATGELRPLSTVSRPGCWINIIPAGGLVLIPEASSGCTCPFYPLQTSLALRPNDCPAPIIRPVAAQRAAAGAPSGECRFALKVSVEIGHAALDAVIRYTLDGAWPTRSSSRYAGPIEVDRRTIIRAMAELPSGQQSSVAQRQFDPVDIPRVLTPSPKFVAGTTIALEQLDGAASLRYTIGGSSPSPSSKTYAAPIAISETTTLRAAYFLNGRCAGRECAERFEKVPGLRAVEPGRLTLGLSYEYYEGHWERLPDFAKLLPRRVGTAAELALPTPRSDFYALRFQGFLDVPTDGIYTFFVSSDDGSRLRVGERVVVDNDGLHDARRQRRGEVALARGKHALDVEFFNGGLQDVLTVLYQGPGLPKRPLPPDVLFRLENGTKGEKP